jgi:hypothetical protein
VASYDADGFTLSWTTNDLGSMNQPPSSDESQADVFYVAVGSSTPTPPATKVRTKVGSFLAPPGTGIQTITGVGFQAKAVIFYWTAQTATGFAANASAGYGFATGAGSERAVVFVSDDSLAPVSNNPAGGSGRTAASPSPPTRRPPPSTRRHSSPASRRTGSRSTG